MQHRSSAIMKKSLPHTVYGSYMNLLSHNPLIAFCTGNSQLYGNSSSLWHSGSFEPVSAKPDEASQ